MIDIDAIKNRNTVGIIWHTTEGATLNNLYRIMR